MATKVRIGLCAMDSKVSGKPMQAILSRVQGTGYFEIVQFGDECILNTPIEDWPVCDVRCRLIDHSSMFFLLFCFVLFVCFVFLAALCHEFSFFCSRILLAFFFVSDFRQRRH
jgi:hypothetical protein